MAETSDTVSINEEIRSEDENITSQDNSDEEEEFDLNASSTESDDSDDAEHREQDLSLVKKSLTHTEQLLEKLKQKYNERQGKQLFIRFPQRLPEDGSEFQQKVKSLSPLIKLAHKPRQKYARFCLVDFCNTEERDIAFKSIRDAIKNNDSFKGIKVSLPRTEKTNFVQELLEKKQKSLEIKKAKKRLKLESKKALHTKNFTSSIVILNLPKNASITEIRKIFCNAVDIQIKPGRGKLSDVNVATITLPSTKDAREAVKQKPSIAGSKLIIRFNTKILNKKKTKSQKRKSISSEHQNQNTLKKNRVV